MKQNVVTLATPHPASLTANTLTAGVPIGGSTVPARVTFAGEPPAPVKAIESIANSLVPVVADGRKVMVAVQVPLLAIVPEQVVEAIAKSLCAIPAPGVIVSDEIVMETPEPLVSVVTTPGVV